MNKMEDRSRCGWHGQDPIYRAYHDTEWGVPETDSRALWEKLILASLRVDQAARRFS